MCGVYFELVIWIMNTKDVIVTNKFVLKALIEDGRLKGNSLVSALDIYGKVEYYCYMRMGKNDKDIYYRKSIESFQILTGLSRNQISNIIKILDELGFINRNHSYKVNKYSKGLIPTGIIPNNIRKINVKEYLTDTELKNRRKRMDNLIEKEVEFQKYNIITMLEIDKNRLVRLSNALFGLNSIVSTVEDDLINLELPTPKLKKLTQEEVELIEKQARLNVKNPNCKATDLEAEIFRLTLKFNWKNMTVHEKEVNVKLARNIFKRLKLVELLNIENTIVKTGNKSKRQYHVLSNAPADIKEILVSKDKNKPYFISLDIKNSQPFILLCLCRANKLPIEDEIASYTIHGQFYELVGNCFLDIDNRFTKDRVKEDKKIRKEIKQMVYRDLFFCKNQTIRKNTKLFKIIEKKFPLFAKAIENLSTIKSKNKEVITLASQLQDLEAETVIPIAKKVKGFSIHDSVLTVSTTCKDSDEITSVKKMLEEKFYKKFKLIPSIDLEIISYRENYNL